MKTDNLINTIRRILIVCVSLWCVELNAQNIGINTTGALPNAKSMLDIDVSGSTPKTGLLIPRMTTTERNAITAPIPESLLIYNTTNQCFEAWNQTAGVWVSFGCVGCTTPSAPLSIAGTFASTSGFTANWINVPGATSYVIDVSTSSTFVSFVSGFSNLNIGNVISTAVTGLTCSTTYYYRVRATNACGTSAYSNTISVTTSVCPISTVSCGAQVWMGTNLNVGTMISETTNQTNNSIVEKYCYNDLPANCNTYGALYQWEEAMGYMASVNCNPCGSSGIQGICPSGYHIPTDLEWSEYEYCLENNIAPTGPVTLNDFQTLIGDRGTTTGEKLKAIPLVFDGNNNSGFNAIPSGFKYPIGQGGYWALDQNTLFWSATENTTTDAFARHLYASNFQSYRYPYEKTYGFSVRCLQD